MKYVVKPGSWLWKAKRAVSSTYCLVEQNPSDEQLRAVLAAYERAEHEFEQAQYLRASSRDGAGAEADKAHRAGRKAYTEGDAAWDAYKAAQPGAAA